MNFFTKGLNSGRKYDIDYNKGKYFNQSIIENEEKYSDSDSNEEKNNQKNPKGNQPTPFGRIKSSNEFGENSLKMKNERKHRHQLNQSINKDLGEEYNYGVATQNNDSTSWYKDSKIKIGKHKNNQGKNGNIKSTIQFSHHKKRANQKSNRSSK